MAIFDSLGGVGGAALGWISSTAFWVFLIVIMLVVFIGILYIRKRRKLNKIVAEFYDEGDARCNFNLTKGGWFKEKLMFMGLWDYGSEFRFRLKDGSPVENVSHNDYRKINGKSGIMVMRNPHDQKICFPINKIFISPKSQAMMMEVAPADFRSAASKAVQDADNEMSSKWAQYAPIIITAIVIMISLIITLLNTQYGKYMVDKAVETMQIIKQTPCSSIASTTAP